MSLQTNYAFNIELEDLLLNKIENCEKFKLQSLHFEVLKLQDEFTPHSHMHQNSDFNQQSNSSPRLQLEDAKHQDRQNARLKK